LDKRFAQGIQVVDRSTGRILQTISLPAVFLGIVFSPDGKSLYVSGGNQDVIYRFDWRAGAATLADSIVLEARRKSKDNMMGGMMKAGIRYPSGIGISPDGRTLYAAENLGDSLAVVDLASRRVVQRLATERYPYGVAVAPDVSAFEPLRDRLKGIEADFNASAKLMSGPGSLDDPHRLLEMQMEVYKLAQNVEIMSRTVSEATSGVKTILQTQV